MTTSEPTRRKFIKWTLSALLLQSTAVQAKLGVALWPDLTATQQCLEAFKLLVPDDAVNLAARRTGRVLAAIYETVDENGDNLRWLCIASETPCGSFEAQTSSSALYTSNTFRPVVVELEVRDDGSVVVGEQGVRSHTHSVWRERDGVWTLETYKFAGVEAHEALTIEHDYTTKVFVETRGLLGSDTPYMSLRTDERELVALTTSVTPMNA